MTTKTPQITEITYVGKLMRSRLTFFTSCWTPKARYQHPASAASGCAGSEASAYRYPCVDHPSHPPAVNVQAAQPFGGRSPEHHVLNYIDICVPRVTQCRYPAVSAHLNIFNVRSQIANAPPSKALERYASAIPLRNLHSVHHGPDTQGCRH